MGTIQTNLEKYLELWDLFEQEIKKSDKLESNTLSGFAKYHEKHDDSEENKGYKITYDKLKKMKKRKNGVVSIHQNTLSTLEEYYKFLKKDFFIQELLDDEHPSSWFD